MMLTLHTLYRVADSLYVRLVLRLHRAMLLLDVAISMYK